MNSLLRPATTSILLLALAVLSSGCATIFKGGTDEISITSNPSGAEVLIDGVSKGRTPMVVEADVDQTYYIDLKLEGHQTQQFIVTHSVGVGWVVLDILGGLIPVIVDAATGNWHELEPDKIHANLVKQ